MGVINSYLGDKLLIKSEQESYGDTFEIFISSVEQTESYSSGTKVQVGSPAFVNKNNKNPNAPNIPSCICCTIL